ncbi:PIF1-like helicase-domain-containing protein, partial [Suillus occidentalis]
LRTVNQNVFATFHEAASDLGLFENNQEGFLTLQEAVDCLRTPSQLRFLFAQIILEGYPASILWDEFKDQLSIDHTLREGDQQNGYRCTLHKIDDILSQSGKRLENFGITIPDKCTAELVNEDRFLASNHAALQAERDNMCQLLNEEQCHAFDTICDGIQSRRNCMFFVEGRPGRGKTFMVNALSSTLRAEGHIILIVGSSALCATAYKRGRTAHYMFGIPVTEDSVDLHSTIHPFSARADLIRNASAIIWDELPMANKAAWECVDDLCRRIMNVYDRPFGGIPIIGLGDFRQVAPVVSGAGEIASLAASVKSSSLWKFMRIFTLTTPVRSIGDPCYTNFVDTLGEDCSGARQSLHLISRLRGINDAIDFLFPPHILDDPASCIQRAFLSPLNVFVDEFNDIMLEALPGDYG